MNKWKYLKMDEWLKEWMDEQRMNGWIKNEWTNKEWMDE